MLLTILVGGLLLYMVACFYKELKVALMVLTLGIIRWGFWPAFVYIFYLVQIKKV